VFVATKVDVKIMLLDLSVSKTEANSSRAANGADLLVKTMFFVKWELAVMDKEDAVKNPPATVLCYISLREKTARIGQWRQRVQWVLVAKMAIAHK
jgi:hypothetical protein